MPKFYATTPIYYVNADPHVGHALTTVVTDALCRIRRMAGDEAILVTGTDEHGRKNEIAAQAQGLSPAEYVGRQSQKFRSVFDELQVDYSHFVRTTAPRHVEAVQHAIVRLRDEGHLVLDDYEGLYCVGCEEFKRTEDLTEDLCCPLHLTKAEAVKETNYFIDLEPHRAWLAGHLVAHEGWLHPPHYGNEIRNLLAQPLGKLCISRPRARVGWGIPFPFDPDYVVYVWFDALLSYVSAIGWPGQLDAEAWEHANNVIGKDILKTHAIYWPIMLRLMGLEPPRHILPHAFLAGPGGAKMSKSLLNVIEPRSMIGLVGVDGLRFVLTRKLRTTADAAIDVEEIGRIYEAELANNIGNLVSRVIKFHLKGGDRRISGEVLSAAAAQAMPELHARLDALLGGLDRVRQPNHVGELLDDVVTTAAAMNQAWNEAAPWAASTERGAEVALSFIGLIRKLFVLLAPVTPIAGEKVLRELGFSGGASTPAAVTWARTGDFVLDEAATFIAFPKPDMVAA